MDSMGSVIGLLLLLMLGLYLFFEMAEIALIILGAALAIASALMIIWLFSKHKTHTGSRTGNGARL